MNRTILSDDQWVALFADEMAGMSRRELAAKYGVHRNTISRQAAERGLQKRVTGAPDQRRVPEGGWPPDRVFPQSPIGMTRRKWDAALDRYLAGEPAAVVAADIGCTVTALTSRAHDDKRQKKDTPGAVYRVSGPRPVSLEDLPDNRLRVRRGTWAFTLSRDDPEATLAELWTLAEQAAQAGEREECLGHLRPQRHPQGLRPAARARAVRRRTAAGRRPGRAADPAARLPTAARPPARRFAVVDVAVPRRAWGGQDARGGQLAGRSGRGAGGRRAAGADRADPARRARGDDRGRQRRPLPAALDPR